MTEMSAQYICYVGELSLTQSSTSGSWTWKEIKAIERSNCISAGWRSEEPNYEGSNSIPHFSGEWILGSMSRNK